MVLHCRIANPSRWALATITLFGGNGLPFPCTHVRIDRPSGRVKSGQLRTP